MKNFDEERRVRVERDRSFQIRGQKFTYRPSVAPEKLVAFYEMDRNVGELEALKILDATVLSLLEPGQEDAWKTARDPDTADAINHNELVELVAWLIKEETGRPTERPSDSSDGSGKTPETGTPSTEPSPSPEPVAA